VLTGLFPGFVNRYLVVPASAAAIDTTGYIDAMMGAGYGQQLGLSPETALSLEYELTGYWDPIAWLVLFVVLLAGLMISLGLGKSSRGPVRRPVPADPKYDTFFGGEASQHSHVGGSDLFWGLKHNLRHYFRFMHSMHSGVVNDYALWTVAGTAVIILFMILFL